MFYVVETKEQLKSLELYRDKPCFIEVIPFSDEIHPKLGKVCLVYYRPLTAKKGFILSINHTETLSLDFESVLRFLRSLQAEIWTIDKKRILYFGLDNKLVKGLKMAYSLTLHEEFPKIEEFDTFTHRFYRRKLKKHLDINRFIPVSKHYEKYEKLFKTLNFIISPGFDFYNDVVLTNFFEIENNGIGIDQQKYEEFLLIQAFGNYKLPDQTLSIDNNKFYTEFSFYNHTARPTCKFNGINFLGLKKKNGERAFIIPTNDLLIEFDYKSYQVKIMADLLGFNFSGDIHTWLAKQYYGDHDGPISENMYTKSKSITFQLMYGREENYTGDIEFYKKLYEFRNGLWKEYKTNEYITSPISGRQLHSMDEISQLLPFLMQCIETERNTLVLDKLNKLLKTYKTKIVLYTYDAFLFDFSLDDGKDLVTKIKEIIEEGNYQSTIKYGDNYSELEAFDPS